VSADAASAGEGREREDAIERAVRALAWQDQSAAMLRAKLERAGVSTRAQADAVETLERIGYVDDSRFAFDRAARLADRGYGDAWIRSDLNGHGIAAETVEAALAGLDPEEERAACAATSARGDVVRVVRRLERRGFSADTIERLLARGIARDGHEGVGYEGFI
jgi:regulatory protein